MAYLQFFCKISTLLLKHVEIIVFSVMHTL